MNKSSNTQTDSTYNLDTTTVSTTPETGSRLSQGRLGSMLRRVRAQKQSLARRVPPPQASEMLGSK